jgi:hypothetical protein
MDAPNNKKSKVKEQLIFDKGLNIEERKKKEQIYKKNKLNE